MPVTKVKKSIYIMYFTKHSQTCHRALSYLQESIPDGSSRQQVHIVCGTQHDVL